MLLNKNAFKKIKQLRFYLEQILPPTLSTCENNAQISVFPYPGQKFPNSALNLNVPLFSTFTKPEVATSEQPSACKLISHSLVTIVLESYSREMFIKTRMGI